ncbi:21144_t:CDS:2 [Dentiscutata erythropus]|uniref:21144_t:CDS:1 n=1 Tax=Dentiscutata erythropus TaxID=1348616 RepID=A0A9N8V7R2_9GLOM|nr:21144_t:CDS:2 [Dentiscutata erythropus]
MLYKSDNEKHEYQCVYKSPAFTSFTIINLQFKLEIDGQLQVVFNNNIKT